MGLLPKIKKELMNEAEVEEIENILTQKSSSSVNDGWDDTHNADEDTEWVTKDGVTTLPTIVSIFNRPKTVNPL